MIAVIADDFTGAAEIGGVALRYGLNVVIETEDIQNHNADLLIIATDTRSLNAREASELIFQITQKLQKLNPEFIFKKVDSVLRGNIAAELNAQMLASGKERSIIIPANPDFNRIVRDGRYYIDNIPLDETSFSNDPEFPIKSSYVKEIIGTEYNKVYADIKPDSDLPQDGLIIGDVSDTSDLEKWADRIDKNTLIAGASGFFDTILSKYTSSLAGNHTEPMLFGKKSLYLFGSKYPKDYDFIKRLETSEYFISNMPENIYFNNNYNPIHLENWANDIVSEIVKNKKVIISIEYTPENDTDIAIRTKETIGKLIKLITDKVTLNELLIEGGSTTSAVLKYLNIKKLFPVQEIEPGVIRMKIDNKPDLCLTTKPGSYYWPESILQTQDIQPVH